jgi:hypothetical protein
MWTSRPSRCSSGCSKSYALREEAARQTALLEAVLAKLGEIERTQYS